MNRRPGPKHHCAAEHTVENGGTKNRKTQKTQKPKKEKIITKKGTTNLCTKIFLSLFLVPIQFLVPEMFLVPAKEDLVPPSF
jgi:hypothetical protein